MAITSVRCLTQDDGVFRLDQKAGMKRSYSRWFQVATDAIIYDPIEIYLHANASPFGKLPQLGDKLTYLGGAYDDGATVVEVHPKRDNNNPLHWNVEVKYDLLSKENKDDKPPTDPSGDATDPRNLDDEISSSWVKYSVPQYSDQNGNAVTNSAGEAFEPPKMLDDYHLVINIGRFVDRLNLTKILNYSNTVNNSKIWSLTQFPGITGKGVPQGYAKILPITFTRSNQNTMGGLFTYWHVTLQIEINQNSWYGRPIDRGFNKLKDTTSPPNIALGVLPITNQAGGTHRTPQLLNGLGQPLTDPAHNKPIVYAVRPNQAGNGWIYDHATTDHLKDSSNSDFGYRDFRETDWTPLNLPMLDMY